MSKLSAHFQTRTPSAIRLAQIEFLKRNDGVTAINTAIGNVSLPMHPVMQERMFHLNAPESPFKNGVVKYTETVGTKEARDAFLNIIKASGFETGGLHVQITDGGSQAMELVVIGCCGPAGTDKEPLLLIDAAYTNYKSMAERLGRGIVSVTRTFGENEKFTLPDENEIRKIVREHRPGAMVVIPYDNPTGHFCDHETMVMLGRICAENQLWMISDEAYRELHYTDQKTSSVWGLTEAEVPGITGRRISIESASKVWNGCGLRIGALVTDNKEFHEKAVAENTASLCPNAIGQYIFGALAHEKAEALGKWFHDQREYYKKLMVEFTAELKKRLQGIMISSPDASIYSVVDVRKIAKPGFDAKDFVLYCARKGNVAVNGKPMTLLVSPMDGFYNPKPGEENPGKTQMRIAYVVPPDEMKLVPELFADLFKEYEVNRR
ncbi:aminotransferase class I/II-fold pyridoxal phosphate-dependent enzyme [Candidatus Peregrinibacteria bacterium]|nr:aminotransferase class I/II-fold pyridoxal phosphate-dependent enzyme [Candidatus Peregrinibacteria bacterium]